ncbi:YggT family protein [Nocardia donostiensis]|uniref:YggT family protein n=1 Tax=Nocardia donostiensis TaxID=1538463 RepID=A0A1V2THI1_9NOCA|nr:YggT family protein [Nocardia donostiensis]ONM48831.1 hypothetical protein B0T46_10105 [Nocardia donostiensis]OQS22914.1 hypothetical protein B0T44_04360 [Nocardia donostiensis]
MSLIGTVLGYVLTAFLLLLIVRLLLDWAKVLASTPVWVDRARDLVHAATEPVIAPVRKLLPPLQLGGLGLDLAFTVVFLLTLILRSIAFSL